jgi:hypothetical protein
MIMVNYANL